ncbi:MAG: hypothetical protein ACYTEW_26155 [Planctomycetota bacterium]|jgi:ammonia channel protein AmtB
MKVKLSEKEKKFLSRMERMNELSHWNYVAVGMIFCLALLSLVTGYVANRIYLFWSLYIGTIGIYFLANIRTHQRFIQIIQKLKDESK